jgi:hypothetical protein
MTTRRPTDNRLDDAPMTAVGCHQCGATVLARKSSWNQTSVQWDADAMATCEERRHADQLSEHGGRGLFLACSAINRSILEAVRNGELSVVDELTTTSS